MQGFLLMSLGLLSCTNASSGVADGGPTVASVPAEVSESSAAAGDRPTGGAAGDLTTLPVTTAAVADGECVTVQATDRTVVVGDFDVVTIQGMIDEFERQQASVLRFRPHDQTVIESGAGLTVTMTHFEVQPAYVRTDVYAEGVSFDGQLAYFVAPLYLAAGRWRFEAAAGDASGCFEVEIPFRDS